jgi:integrase
MECLRLGIKDVDFGQRHLIVRDAKAPKDRVTTRIRAHVLKAGPSALAAPLMPPD